MKKEPKYLPVPQAAARLGCSPGLLYREIRARRFPAVMIGRKILRVPMTELRAWQAKQLVAGK